MELLHEYEWSVFFGWFSKNKNSKSAKRVLGSKIKIVNFMLIEWQMSVWPEKTCLKCEKNNIILL